MSCVAQFKQAPVLTRPANRFNVNAPPRGTTVAREVGRSRKKEKTDLYIRSIS